jgi:hypothetical protein
MKKISPLAVLIMSLFAVTNLVWGQDGGVPDTLYVEIYPQDQCMRGYPPYLVRFPIYVTNDIVDPVVDSIAGFVFSLCYEYTGYGAVNFCRATAEYNNTACAYGVPLDAKEKSIFRHLPSMVDPQILHPWMEKTEDSLLAKDIWDYRELTLYGNYTFWLSLVPTSSKDKRWEGGSRVLLATITIEIDFEDSLLLCIDTCYWPPGGVGVRFSNSDAETYIPEDNFPACASICRTERGDANGDGAITITDVLYMLNYLFRKGPPPVSFIAGDANSDDDLGILDPLFLLRYLYRSGSPPSC